MVALAVILTFAIMLVIDHFLVRQPIVVVEARKEAPARARLIPAVVAGFEVPDNLRYHPGHTWAVAETPDLVRVGLDDFAAKFAGTPDEIVIPERGQWIRQGQKIISLKRDGREIELVSPIEGAVVEINEAAIKDPEKVGKDPYGEGWLLSVNSPDARTNFRNLLGGSIARKWMEDAAATLRSFAAPAGAMAQDGGVAVDDLRHSLPGDDWDRIRGELFLT
jgi:glycine cleavage system H protein